MSIFDILAPALLGLAGGDNSISGRAIPASSGHDHTWRKSARAKRQVELANRRKAKRKHK